MRIIALLLILASAASAQDLQNLDLSSWNALLGKYVNDKGMVNYKGLKAADLAALDGFLGKLAAAKPATFANDKEREAFWINAYNACVIRNVITHYPTESVMKVPDFFKKKSFSVAGETVSLDDIEHVKIRPIFKDPRVHFALVCAAKSCPRLLNRAFTGMALDQTLDNQAREFLADPSKNKFEDSATGPVAWLSQIFRWFNGDFVDNAGSTVGYLKKYAPASVQPMLAHPALRIKHLEYDWKLNEQ
jgi:hypothetical protein